MKPLNKSFIIEHSSKEYDSMHSAFVDLYGNILLDDDGNTVNRYHGLRKLIDNGKVKLCRDVRFIPSFNYIVTTEAQKKDFDNFVQTGNVNFRNRLFHVYNDSPLNGDLIQENKNNKQFKINYTEDEEYDELLWNKWY